MPHAGDNRLKNTIRKHDKLKSSQSIETLYRANQFVLSYPLKCYYSLSELKKDENAVLVAFTVPKRMFKYAVVRNRLKRRMREAYRLNYKKILESLFTQNQKQLQLLFIFIGKEITDYGSIEKSMQVQLSKINEKITTNHYTTLPYKS